MSRILGASHSGKIQVCNNTDWVDVGGAESGGVWSLTGNDISNTNIGNVGVGEPSPTTKLHVNGKTTTDAILLKRQVGIAAPTSTAGWNYSGGDMDFSGGNVGIGTSNPSGRLHVQNGGTFSGIVNSNNLGIFAKTTATNSVAVLNVVGGSSGVAYLTLGGDGPTTFDDGRVSYDASDSSLGLWTNNAQRFSIDSSGLVGIGTTSPTAELHIAGAGGNGIRIEAGNNTSAVYLDFADSDDSNPGQITYNHTGDYLAFRANDAERMRITSTGNVGIGTLLPESILHLGEGSGATAGKILFSTFNNRTASVDVTSNGLELEVFNTNSPTIYQDILLAPNGGNVGIGTTSPSFTLDVNGSARVYGGSIIAGPTGSTSEGGQVDFVGAASHPVFYLDNYQGNGRLFWTSANKQYLNFANYGAGAFEARVEGDFVTDGNLGIGTTNTAGARLVVQANAAGKSILCGEGNPSSNCHIDAFNGAGTRGIYLNYYTGTSVYLTGGALVTSDARKKKNIMTLSNALNGILNIRGVTYNWKDPKRDNSAQMGVIAQEVQTQFPELVKDDGYGFLTVNYGGLIAPLIEAIKELNAMNVISKARIESLESQNDYQTTEIEKVTALNNYLRHALGEQGRDIELLKASIHGH